MLTKKLEHGDKKKPFIYVTDNVSDLVLDFCYTLNCVLKLNPKPGLFPKKVKFLNEKARAKVLLF